MFRTLSFSPALFLILVLFSFKSVFSQVIIYDSTRVIFSSPQFDYYNPTFQSIKYLVEPGFIFCEKKGVNNSNIVYKLDYYGSNFSQEKMLTNDNYQNLNPCMSLNYVVWQSNRRGHYDIYFAEKYQDTLYNQNIVDSSEGDKINPYITYAFLNGNVLFYQKNNKIYYRTETGSPWGQEYECTSEFSYPCSNPKAIYSIVQPIVILCFYVQVNSTTSHIYVKKASFTTNGGLNWISTENLNQPGSQRNMSICYSYSPYLFYDYDTLGSTHVMSVNLDSLNKKYIMTSQVNGNNSMGTGYNIRNYIPYSYQNIFSDIGWINKTNDSTNIMIMKNLYGTTTIHKFYIGNSNFNSSVKSGFYWIGDSTFRQFDIAWEQMLNGKRAIVSSFFRQTTSIINIGTEVPENFKLYQNYPNPFNPVTKIKFDINTNVSFKKPEVKLVVYNILGHELLTLVNEKLNPGSYEVTFDGSNLPSGIYFYRLQTDNYSETRKMLLIK